MYVNIRERRQELAAARHTKYARELFKAGTGTPYCVAKATTLRSPIWLCAIDSAIALSSKRDGSSGSSVNAAMIVSNSLARIIHPPLHTRAHPAKLSPQLCSSDAARSTLNPCAYEHTFAVYKAASRWEHSAATSIFSPFNCNQQ